MFAAATAFRGVNLFDFDLTSDERFFELDACDDDDDDVVVCDGGGVDEFSSIKSIIFDGIGERFTTDKLLSAVFTMHNFKSDLYAVLRRRGRPLRVPGIISTKCCSSLYGLNAVFNSA